MATITVSGRIDETTKRLADRYIKKHGTTANEVIASVWRHIAETGEIPFASAGSAERERKRAAAQNIMQLRETVPTGTPLSTMTPQDLKRELANRG